MITYNQISAIRNCYDLQSAADHTTNFHLVKGNLLLKDATGRTGFIYAIISAKVKSCFNTYYFGNTVATDGNDSVTDGDVAIDVRDTGGNFASVSSEDFQRQNILVRWNGSANVAMVNLCTESNCQPAIAANVQALQGPPNNLLACNGNVGGRFSDLGNRIFTTDATLTTIVRLSALNDSRIHKLEALVESVKDDGSAAQTVKIEGGIKSVAGVLTVVDSFRVVWPTPVTLTASFGAFDPASLPAGTSQHFDKTVTGAVAGDFVQVSLTADALDTVWTGQVSAADTVRVVQANVSAGALDVGSGTLAILVTRYPVITWPVTVSISGADVLIKVTGQAATTIRHGCRYNLTSVMFNSAGGVA